MLDIHNYILSSKEERQKHLKLEEECIEQGNARSHQLRVLLAFLLDTTVPLERNIYCCHACNNEKCRNPYHLYWGTPKENRDDSLIGDRNPRSIWQKAKAKYGVDIASSIWKAALRRDFRWLIKEGIEKQVPNSEVDHHLKDGWIFGRTNNYIRSIANRKVK